LHAFTYNTIDLVLVLILITGSIAGVHSGQKVGQRLQGSELKTLLALLMLGIGVLMAYDTFFRNGTPSIQIPTDKIVEISEFGNTIFNLSDKYPVVYGVSSIFLALVAGVAVSFIRRQISKRINKPSMY
jgi:NADH:ubiquinone oxidoreductase subunit 6 (subunit J)